MDQLLVKLKQPGERAFSYACALLQEDHHGSWLLLERGAAWHAPHDQGHLAFPVVVLIPRADWWVAWWVPRSEDERLEVDVCVPAQRRGTGWSFVDLELDVFLHRDSGEVTVEDRDEFDEAVELGVMSPDHAREAERVTGELVRRLEEDTAAWVAEGWALLDAAQVRTRS